MGYLTTITFYNDEIADLVTKNGKDYMKLLQSALHGNKINNQFSNNIIVQRPRHSNDSTLYLHSGNTVIDLNNVSDAMKDDAIQQLEYHLKKLKPS